MAQYLCGYQRTDSRFQKMDRRLQVLRIVATILGLDDVQRRRLEQGARRLVGGRAAGGGGGGGGGLGLGLLFRAPALGWGALTEADIGEQARRPLCHTVECCLSLFCACVYLCVGPSHPSRFNSQLMSLPPCLGHDILSFFPAVGPISCC
jgi:hypothetical protein